MLFTLKTLVRASAMGFLCTLFVAPTSAADAVIAIKGKKIYGGSGAPIDNGVILVREGKIAAIGAKVEIPEGAKTIDVSDLVITPGLVDACCMVDDELPAGY